MSNRLATASSPYLRMHAGNPVDWQPWDDAALAQARATDTPILLSIGYSACHWCHVMAHECFENAAIAAQMNESFVNIKLDREERPDIDRVYQLAHQALTGRGGGWPLTLFLDPRDLAPFFAGTYFPPVTRHGLPAFPQVLRGVREYFDANRGELRERATVLRDWLQRAEGTGGGAAVDPQAVTSLARQRIATSFDPDWGGTRGAPKFPRPAELEWLLDQHADTDALAMAYRTLGSMAQRGLQDHLGGGFFRYCVDAEWTIPHFEKMLYDNAALLPAYARMALATDVDTHERAIAERAARGIVAWLAREMSAADGALFSALDADGPDGEGSFYLWTREQVHAALPDALHATADRLFGLDGLPNFEGRAWHLIPVATPDDDAQRAHMRERLFAARAHRDAPARDDKILTAWNALAIAGLARTARLLDDAPCAAMAQRTLVALRRNAWIDGALFANAAAPADRIPGFLDDYAFTLDALLETLQLDFDARDLAWAIALADALCAKFADRESGGFWFSTEQHATPLARSRSWTDDALPNGNAVAIRSLLRLGHLIGETRYLDSAERALRAAAGSLQQYPEACPSLLRALAEFEHPRTQIVVRASATQAGEWRRAVSAALAAAGIVPGGTAVDAFIISDTAPTLPGLLAERNVRGGTGTGWVCSGLTCQPPVTAPDELAATLRRVVADRGAATRAE